MTNDLSLSLSSPLITRPRKKKSKDEERKLDEMKVGLIKDPKLAEDLIKLAEEKKVSDDLIEQIAGKEIIKPQLTKAELAFKNKQEKMVCAFSCSQMMFGCCGRRPTVSDYQ